MFERHSRTTASRVEGVHKSLEPKNIFALFAFGVAPLSHEITTKSHSVLDVHNNKKSQSSILIA